MTEPIGLYALGLVTMHIASHTSKDGKRLLGGLMFAAGVLQCVVAVILGLALLTERTT